MLLKVVAAAVFAAVVAPIGAHAQSIAQIGGPAELPPTTYRGQQYVDSRGCIFMRVETSGAARWYPRVNAAHKAVCLQTKPDAAMDTVEDVPKLVPAPVVRGRAPMATVASRMMPEARVKPVAKRAPVQVVRATTKVVAVPSVPAAEPDFEVPKGYRLAWRDDRLNPLRGKGTAEGQAAQDQIWTRKVPATLVSDAARKKAASAKVTISTMNAPVKAAQGGGRAFVQIGSFGVASNARGAVARLQAVGLPVATSKLVRGGRELQVVLVGPFGSAAEAKAALAQARRAGFGDAFLR
jgi:cell division septation protein DedD